MHRRAVGVLLDTNELGRYSRNRDEQAQEDRGREYANSKVRREFLHSYLIIAFVASNFFNRFAIVKVHRLLLLRLLLRLLLCILPKREISLFLSFRFLGPLRLILSRVYLITLTKRELSPRRCPLLANLACWYFFFSCYTRCCKIPSSSRLPSRPNCRKLPGISPSSADLPSSLPLVDFLFLTRSLCFANSFSQLFRDLSHLSLAKWHFSRSGQRHMDFPSFNSELCLWIFYTSFFFFVHSCKKLFVVYIFPVHVRRETEKCLTADPLCSMQQWQLRG